MGMSSMSVKRIWSGLRLRELAGVCWLISMIAVDAHTQSAPSPSSAPLPESVRQLDSIQLAQSGRSGFEKFYFRIHFFGGASVPTREFASVANQHAGFAR